MFGKVFVVFGKVFVVFADMGHRRERRYSQIADFQTSVNFTAYSAIASRSSKSRQLSSVFSMRNYADNFIESAV